MAQAQESTRKVNGVDIANKTILVTGASRGIGRALIEEALKRGAKRVYAGTRGPLQLHDERLTSVPLDVTSDSQIQAAVKGIDTLDVLINNAGIAQYEDLTDMDTIGKHLAVNVFGLLKMTNACLPLLGRSGGAVVNNLSMVGLAPLPVIPAYSLSKAAALSATQSMRALLAGRNVTLHAVILGPIDTDMNRGFDIPKASPESAAQNIFEGLKRGDEDIFPDPASLQIAEAWRNGIAKSMERQFAAFAPQTAAISA